MYHLPNREYYAQLRGMSESELILTLKNVLFYCALQLASLLLLFLALKKKLGLSPFHHLAFVLDKQFIAIQVKLCFWVYYNAQASLQHSGLVVVILSPLLHSTAHNSTDVGYDYTFQFPWLQQSLTE
ncbi:hypothetical protein DVH05_005940 [Phytophthora capsici]|nr:hypothetical protein DVH05_005940 [Phytophthora capsici]